MGNCVILRYGEIGLKSARKRVVFERFYIDALKEALDRNGFKDYLIRNLGGRFTIEHELAENIVNIVKNVPGVQSVSPSFKLEFSSKEDLIMKIKGNARSLVEGKTFRIVVKRTGNHDFSSMDLARDIGSSLYEFSKGVKMDKPDVEISIEVRKDEAYIYTKSIEAIGGLPPRSAGKFLCLFSGGIDSPVAAYKIIKRGAKADFLFINLVGEKALYDVAQIYNYLCSQYVFGYEPKLFVVDGREIVAKIKDEVNDNLRQIALKIFFYKMAEKIADMNHHWAIVTGETLSQKSSQTVESLSVIQSQVKALVLRPLITYDKIEIMKIARKIGTMGASEKITEYCNLSEGPVSTAPSMLVLKKIPSFDEEIKKAVETMYTYKGIAEVSPTEEKDICDMKDAKIVYISNKMQNDIDADMSYSYPDILNHIDSLDHKEKYLFVCDHGITSESVAFLLRKKGISAKGMSLKEFKNAPCSRG